MRTYEVLENFNYCPDGIKTLKIKKGATSGINEDVIDKMIKRGHIKETDIKDDSEDKKKLAKEKEELEKQLLIEKEKLEQEKIEEEKQLEKEIEEEERLKKLKQESKFQV